MRLGRGPVAFVAVLLAATTAYAEQSRTTLSDVQVRGEGERAEVILSGDLNVPSYSLRSRKRGRVVVIEVDNTALPKQGLVRRGTSRLVSGTRASTTARGVHVEVDLAEPATYRARVEDGKIIVRFEPLGAEVHPKRPAAKGGLSVRDAHLERRNGRDRVVIQLSDAAEFRVLPGNVGPARLAIPKASLAQAAPSELKGQEDSVIEGVRLRREGDRILVEVDRKEGARGTAIREGRRIVWLFAPKADQKPTPRTRTVAREARPVEVDTDEVAGFGLDLPAQFARARKTYSGRRIDLDFKDADIHNILRLLAEVGGINVITSDDVDGAVTIRMRNVPWDQALDVILSAKGLGMVRKGNLIRVAPQTVLEKERELAIARKKQQVELAPLETRLVPVSYATAKEMAKRIKELLSARGTVAVDERTNVLIVRDVVDALDDVEELIRSLDTQTPQVLVEARIVEATSNYVRDVGIQWGGDASFNQAFGNQTGLVFPSNVGITGGAYDAQAPTQGLSPITDRTQVPNFAVNLPAAVGTGAGGAMGLTLGSVDGNFNLSVRLSAAEASGAVRIVSSPRILTLDNNTASIEQGTLIPYSQVSAQGVQTAFQEAKLSLEVTPHVTADGAVQLDVSVTRDEPDFTRTSARGDPTILKREAETQLLVEDGRTAVIGGIYTRNSGRTVDQVPFFGDIPILGVLFQRRRMTDQRNELLIFLTPRIVNREQSLVGPRS